MKRIIAMLMLTASFMFAAMNLQTASKEELMTIKGIGEKKAEAIIKYRKKNKIKSADDLINIKGFGEGIIKNVKKNVKVSDGKTSSKSTKEKKSTKKTAEKKSSSKKSSDKKTKSTKSKKDEVIIKKK